MPDSNLEKQVYESYLAAIKNSVGSKLFNTFVVKNLKENRTYDVLNDGEYSCAYYVSGLLTIFGLIDRPHTTVKTVTDKLLEAGWVEVSLDQAKPGDVLNYDFMTMPDGEVTNHDGFYLDPDTAVSIDYKQKSVVKHDLTYGKENGKPVRKVVQVLHYSKF